jgi:hypothetical protein
VFSTRSVPRCYKQGARLKLSQLIGGEEKIMMLVWNGRYSIAWKAGFGTESSFRVDLSPEAEDNVRSICQATIREDIAGWKRFSLIFWSVEIAIVLYLFAVTTCQCPINPIIQSAVYSHSNTWQYVGFQFTQILWIIAEALDLMQLHRKKKSEAVKSGECGGHSPSEIIRRLKDDRRMMNWNAFRRKR